MALKWFLRYSHISKKYKLRLVGMLVCVFSGFNFIIFLILKAKAYEPFLLELDNSGWLGYFVGSPLFSKGASLFLGSLNLGSSSETLLAIMLLISFILILLVILSYYVRIFLAFFVGAVGFISSQVFSLLRHAFYKENDVVWFDHGGLSIRLNWGLKDPTQLFAKINSVYDVLLKEFLEKVQGRPYKVDTPDLKDLKALQEEILSGNFETWASIENFLKERMSDCFATLDNIDTLPTESINILASWPLSTFIGGAILIALLFAMVPGLLNLNYGQIMGPVHLNLIHPANVDPIAIALAGTSGYASGFGFVVFCNLMRGLLSTILSKKRGSGGAAEDAGAVD